MRRIVVFLAALGVLVGLSAVPAAANPDFESEFVSLINQERAARGLSTLQVYWDLLDDARAHSADMASAGDIWHNPELADVTTGWYMLGENVGMGGGVQVLHDAFMDSPSHRDNVLHASYDYVGVGVVVNSQGTIFVTVVFMDGPGGLVGSPAYTPPFWDDDGSLHEADIIALWEEGITKGCNRAGDRYCPVGAVTRGQMAAFLARQLGLSGGRDAFADDAGHPFEGAINAVAAAGLARGCGGGNFCPDAPVTRAQAASLMARALGAQGGRDAFVDDDGSVHEADINALAKRDVAKGCGTATFCPDQSMTREQMASFLVRAFG